MEKRIETQVMKIRHAAWNNTNFNACLMDTAYPGMLPSSWGVYGWHECIKCAHDDLKQEHGNDLPAKEIVVDYIARMVYAMALHKMHDKSNAISRRITELSKIVND